MDDSHISFFYGIILEFCGVFSLLINLLSIFRMFNGDYLKQSAACVFLAAIITNAIFSLIFVIFVGPTLILSNLLFSPLTYTLLDAVGGTLWNLGGLLSATMAIERLAVLALPQFTLLFKNGPLFGVIGVEVLYSFTSWVALCRHEMDSKLTINTDTFELSFPREFNYTHHSICASVGLGIDFTVTAICLLCYSMVYWKLKSLNNASGCLLTERAKYKRKQKEVKVAADFFISSLVYIVFWVMVRFIKPLIPSENRPVFVLLLLLQILHSGIMALTSILFFKETPRPKATNPNSSKLHFRENCKKLAQFHFVRPSPAVSPSPVPQTSIV